MTETSCVELQPKLSAMIEHERPVIGQRRWRFDGLNGLDIDFVRLQGACLLLTNPPLFELPIQSLPIEPEQLCGFCSMPTGRFEHSQNIPLLDFFQTRKLTYVVEIHDDP